MFRTLVRTHAFCKNLTADMWAICFVLCHPAIPSLIKHLLGLLRETAPFKRQQDYIFKTTTSQKPPSPPFTPYRLSQSDRGKGKECVKGRPEFLYTRGFLRAEAIDGCFVCLKSVLLWLHVTYKEAKERVTANVNKECDVCLHLQNHHAMTSNVESLHLVWKGFVQ